MEEATVMPGAWIVGRNPECDFVVDQPPVSGRHCRVIQDGSRIFLEDLGSRNGTYINSKKIPASSRHPLDVTDRVNLGTHAIDPAELIAFVERMSPPELVFRGGELVVGRSSDCDLVIDLPSISSRHARVFRSGDRTYVEDLASANGTFVNDQRIPGRREVRTGDRISLAGRTLAFREELPVASPSHREKTEILDPSPDTREGERPSPRAAEVLLEESIPVGLPSSITGGRGGPGGA